MVPHPLVSSSPLPFLFLSVFSLIPSHSPFVGYGEYAGRECYAPLIKALNQANYTVLAHDHQGHGRSKGDRGYVATVDGVAGDLFHFVKETSAAYPGSIRSSLFLLNLKTF